MNVQNARSHAVKRRPVHSRSSRAGPVRARESDHPALYLYVQSAICLIVVGVVLIMRLSGAQPFEGLRVAYDKMINHTDFSASVDAVVEYFSASPLVKQVISLFGSDAEDQSSSVPADSSAADQANAGASQNSQTDPNGAGGADNTGSTDTASGQNSQNTQSSATQTDTAFYSPPQGATFAPFFISSTFITPVCGRVTSGFGYRYHPITGKFGFHSGLDIAAPKGTPIACPLGGTVKETGQSGVYGNYIIVQHGVNIQTFYGHCDQVLPKVGTVLRQGDTVGLVGSTGNATGDHLHFEIWIDGIKADPEWILHIADGKVVD